MILTWLALASADPLLPEPVPQTPCAAPPGELVIIEELLVRERLHGPSGAHGKQSDYRFMESLMASYYEPMIWPTEPTAVWTVKADGLLNDPYWCFLEQAWAAGGVRIGESWNGVEVLSVDEPDAPEITVFTHNYRRSHRRVQRALEGGDLAMCRVALHKPARTVIISCPAERGLTYTELKELVGPRHYRTAEELNRRLGLD